MKYVGLKLIAGVVLFAGWSFGAIHEPADILQEDLRLNYRIVNAQYFQDHLPHDVDIRVVDDITELDKNGNVVHLLGQCVAKGIIPKILISHDLNPTVNQARMTEMHEMCHLEAFRLHGNIDFPKGQEHGKLFYTCMKTLATEGAFDELW